MLLPFGVVYEKSMQIIDLSVSFFNECDKPHTDSIPRLAPKDIGQTLLGA